jgi:hypothetical protein
MEKYDESVNFSDLVVYAVANATTMNCSETKQDKPVRPT